MSNAVDIASLKLLDERLRFLSAWTIHHANHVRDKSADGLKVRLVHASKGKSARAEPVALRFEAGRAYFAGEFRELEDELAGMQAGHGYEGPGRSPDRADAMVWALTALSETRSGVPRVRRL
jgi:phage terminase large subunit-like protein